MKHRLLMYVIFVASLALTTATNAATVDFKATVNDGGIFDGIFGTGSITYDQTTIDGVGEEYIDLYTDTSLLMSFNLFGQSFSATDDADYDPFDIFFPFLTFVDGTLSYLSYSVSETGPNVKAIDQVGIDSFGLYNDPEGYDRGSILTLLGGVYQGDLTIDGVLPPSPPPSAVPVPAAAWLFGSALLGFVGFGRRKNIKA